MLSTNTEFKAYCHTSIESIAATCSELGAMPLRTVRQTDTYYRSSAGRLKLRVDEPGAAALVFYDRPDMPAPRESHYQSLPVQAPADAMSALLGRALGVRSVVEKIRQVYRLGAASINLDVVDGLGTFLEVEVDVRAAGGLDPAQQTAEQLLTAFGLSQADIIPWSYAELQIMFEVASTWRAKLRSHSHPGTLFLLDGASCSGKSTLVKGLIPDAVAVDLVPRYSTRERRQDDQRCGEYIFVSHAAFRDLAFTGGFIEYRDFQFGMSYGLPWAEACSPLLAGRHAVGVINLGNVRHVKAVFPEAVTILVDASLETIRQRLVSRGMNTPEQIEERLANAARVAAYRPLYDYVVTNEEGTLGQAEQFLRELILRRTP